MAILKKKTKVEKEKSKEENTDSTQDSDEKQEEQKQEASGELTEEQIQEYQKVVNNLSHSGEATYQMLAKWTEQNKLLHGIQSCLIVMQDQQKSIGQTLVNIGKVLEAQ